MATFLSPLSSSNDFGLDSHPIDPALAGEADICLQKAMLSSPFSPHLSSKVLASIWMILSPASMLLNLTAREEPRELISTPQFSYTKSQTGFFRPCFRLLSVVETFYFYKDSVWQSGRYRKENTRLFGTVTFISCCEESLSVLCICAKCRADPRRAHWRQSNRRVTSRAEYFLG